MKPEVVVLLSGGVDSTACIHFYTELKRPTEGLFIDYGQPAAIPELRAAKRVVEYYSIPLRTLALQGVKSKKTGMIMGRNAFLVTVALLESVETNRVIASGIHAGTEYPDCSQLFIERMQAVIDLYREKRLQLASPFITWSKAEIYAYCKESQIPIELTYSCERGGASPCGKCLSCRDRQMFYAGA